MIEQRTDLERPDYLPRTAGLTAGLASATAAGVAFGVLTLWMQGHLDGNWNVLANSGAVWTVVAVLIAAVCGSSVAVSAAAGTLALLGEVAGYYWFAAPWHGIAVTQSEQMLWTATALVVGPFAGLGGFALLRGTVTHRVASLLCVAGVVAGEGLYGLADLPEHRLASQIETALGVAVAASALLVSRAAWHRRAAALVLGAAVAGVVLFVYSAPYLVL